MHAVKCVTNNYTVFQKTTLALLFTASAIEDLFLPRDAIH